MKLTNENIVKKRGEFTVTKNSIGRYMLYHKDNPIASCIYFEKTHKGSIHCWLKKIKRREEKAVNTNLKTIRDLWNDCHNRWNLLDAMRKFFAQVTE